jgi:hypothetical protein
VASIARCSSRSTPKPPSANPEAARCCCRCCRRRDDSRSVFRRGRDGLGMACSFKTAQVENTSRAAMSPDRLEKRLSVLIHSFVTARQWRPRKKRGYTRIVTEAHELTAWQPTPMTAWPEAGHMLGDLRRRSCRALSDCHAPRECGAWLVVSHQTLSCSGQRTDRVPEYRKPSQRLSRAWTQVDAPFTHGFSAV